jgi:hypothetical protein
MEKNEAFPKVLKDVYEFMGESGAAELSKIESNHSKGITTLRAQMENIFGFIKNKFKSLKEPFKESVYISYLHNWIFYLFIYFFPLVTAHTKKLVLPLNASFQINIHNL